MDADLAEQDVEEGEPGLPTSSPSFSRAGKGNGGGLMSGVFGGQNGGGAAQAEDEFRPFIRRLPEFKVGATRLGGKDEAAIAHVSSSPLC